ncbi:MAG TPA: nitrous oxide reductase family maturation protein NosD [Thermomicrobiales bacterium]|nr:nitrous oxide reductase family maturation protein NosD [Thermomicrobiales bacterium]
MRSLFTVLLAAMLLMTGGILARPAPAQADPAPATAQVCPTCALNSVAAAISAAATGTVIEVRGGSYAGPIVVDKPITLRGVDNPVINGQDKGTVIHITSDNVTITGFTIKGTGSSHDKEDAAILVEAEHATVAENTINDALFGIVLRKSHHSVIRDNIVRSKAADIALRGDGIKIWYSDDVVLDGNQASDGRDIILWYSNRAQVRNNQFNRERYGLHLMFSDKATITGNSLQSNSIGLYIMYSRDPVVTGNILSNNHGPSGGGLGLKDVDRAVIEGNRFVNNKIAAQVDTSPRELGIENIWTGNVFAYNEIGLAFMPSVRHNTLTENAFIDNTEQVAILGGGQLRDITWSKNGQGNYWSDYAGFDANGDGIGDRPYRSEKLFESLMGSHPNLRLFLFSPSATAIDFAARAFPSFRPETKLEDSSPLMSPPHSTLLPAANTPSPEQRLAFGLFGAIAILGAVATIRGLRANTGGPRVGRRIRRAVAA